MVSKINVSMNDLSHMVRSSTTTVSGELEMTVICEFIVLGGGGGVPGCPSPSRVLGTRLRMYFVQRVPLTFSDAMVAVIM